MSAIAYRTLAVLVAVGGVLLVLGGIVEPIHLMPAAGIILLAASDRARRHGR
jgi:hypothetical protein